MGGRGEIDRKKETEGRRGRKIEIVVVVGGGSRTTKAKRLRWPDEWRERKTERVDGRKAVT